MENNPNMIDSSLTPERCVIHATELGEMVQSHRKLFLHKGSWPKFKGHAYSQMQKIIEKRGGEKRCVDYKFLEKRTFRPLGAGHRPLRRTPFAESGSRCPRSFWPTRMGSLPPHGSN